MYIYIIYWIASKEASVRAQLTMRRAEQAVWRPGQRRGLHIVTRLGKSRYIYIHTHTHIYTYICIYIYISISIYVSISISISMDMYLNIYIYVYTHIPTYIYVGVYFLGKLGRVLGQPGEQRSKRFGVQGSDDASG